MRKIILGLAVSLDGFIEGPNGEYDWCFTDQDYGMSEFFKRIDSVFIGRKSYEVLMSAEGGTSMFPKMKYYVFSHTLKVVKDGFVISGDTESEVRRIKDDEGKDIWLFGGAELTAGLMNLKLVDELSLAVHPILLGSGKPLFNGIEGRIPLELRDSKTYDSGLVSLTYDIRK